MLQKLLAVAMCFRRFKKCEQSFSFCLPLAPANIERQYFEAGYIYYIISDKRCFAWAKISFRHGVDDIEESPYRQLPLLIRLILRIFLYEGDPRLSFLEKLLKIINGDSLI